MNTVIYARSSTSEQQCKQQIEKLKQHAQKNGIKIVGVYSDTSFVQTVATPPGLRQMLKDIAAKKNISTILCTGITRLTRHARSLSALRVSSPKVNILCLDGSTI